MPLGTILVVEDDEAIRRGLRDALSFAGYDVREAGDGQAGLDAALGADVDLVLLDVLMPRMDGMAMLERLRVARPSMPVIMLTARGEETDRVAGLRAGADDYVVKPFAVAEVVARIEAVLRRTPERPCGVERLEIAGRVIDFDRREVVRPDGTRVTLSQRETETLSYLAANRGRAVSRDELLSRVWGVDPRGMSTRTVDMAITRVREHLQDDPGRPCVVLTVRGSGYMLAAEGGP